MGITDLVRRKKPAGELEQRTSYPLPFNDWLDYFKFNGNSYVLPSYQQTLLGDVETISGSVPSIVSRAVNGNSIIFACMLVRLLHFTEARFQFRQIRQGRPGNLFGTSALSILERPWPNGTTGDLLARMIQDADVSGNSFIVAQGDRLARLRPDWVDIVVGSRTDREDWVAGDVDTEVAGYLYTPGGKGSNNQPVAYPVEAVAHFAPIPNPLGLYAGVSWINAVLAEVLADKSMTRHRQKFFDQGATVNLVVKLTPPKMDDFNSMVRKFREGHESVANAYKTLFVTQGTDVIPVGKDMQEIDFKATQGAGETRIAAAARTPPVLVGLSEGLQGSSLNQGNYQAARRQFADGVMRPMWRQAAGALATIINVPKGAELSYDDRDIAFLREDIMEIAETQQKQAAAMQSMVSGGWKPDAIIDAITSNDFSRLVGQHTGLTSVQLVPPGTGGPSGGTALAA